MGARCSAGSKIEFSGNRPAQVDPLAQHREDWRMRRDLAVTGADVYEPPGEALSDAPAREWVQHMQAVVTRPARSALPARAPVAQSDVDLLVGPNGHVLLGCGPERADLWCPDAQEWTRLDTRSQWRAFALRPTARFSTDGRTLFVADEKGFQALALDGGPSAPGAAAFADALKARSATIREFLLHPDGAGIAALVDTPDGPRIAIGDVSAGRVRIGPVVPGARGPLVLDASGARLICIRQGEHRWAFLEQDWHDPEGRARMLAWGWRGEGPRALLAHPFDPNEVAMQHSGFVTMVDLSAGRVDVKAQLGATLTAMTYHPRNGMLVAEGQADRHLVHPDGNTLLARGLPDDAALDIAYHPGGEWYVTVHEGGTVQNWNAQTHRPWLR